MLGEVQGYFLAFSERWLLAIIGSLILILDLWVVFEGVRILLSDTGRERAVSGAGA